MRFVPTDVANVHLVLPERREDHRGYFMRTFCQREFEAAGLPLGFVQANLSWTREQHTLRGLHFQNGDAAEDKLVRCVKGRVLDVALDLRRDSPTFRKFVMAELSEDNGHALLVPRGCAHGFLSLEPDVLIAYQVSNYYSSEAEGGVRWNDPAFAIPWPVKEPILSAKDAAYPDFKAD